MTDSNLPTRVVFAALRPAVRLANTFGISLKDVKRFAELAYYQDSKRRGMKMREIAEALGISMSKVGLLSKQLKDHFLEPELEHGVGRQILTLLWAAPLTEIRIAQALPDFNGEDVQQALEVLVTEGRVRRVSGRTDTFELTSGAQRLDNTPWMARIDGLNTLLDSVTQTVESRFERNDNRAFVRNLAFRVRPEDLGKIQEYYEKTLFPLIVELDEAVVQENDSVPIRLSILWSPTEENK